MSARIILLVAWRYSMRPEFKHDIDSHRDYETFGGARDELTWYMNNFWDGKMETMQEAIQSAAEIGIEVPEGWVYFLN